MIFFQFLFSKDWTRMISQWGQGISLFGTGVDLLWGALQPLLWPVLFVFGPLPFLIRALLVDSGLLFWWFTFSNSSCLSFRLLAINPGFAYDSIFVSLSRLDAGFLLPWRPPLFCSSSAPENKPGQVTLLSECMWSVGFLKTWGDCHYLKWIILGFHLVAKAEQFSMPCAKCHDLTQTGKESNTI